jgi:hypothetical protein
MGPLFFYYSIHLSISFKCGELATVPCSYSMGASYSTVAFCYITIVSRYDFLEYSFYYVPRYIVFRHKIEVIYI